MDDQYKIYCYAFENNNKTIIPNNFKITIRNIIENNNETHYPNYECINYLLAFNIDRYNDKHNYLLNEYRKNNIEVPVRPPNEGPFFSLSEKKDLGLEKPSFFLAKNSFGVSSQGAQLDPVLNEINSDYNFNKAHFETITNQINENTSKNIDNVYIVDDDPHYISRGNNKLFTLNDLILHVSKLDRDINTNMKHITIVTVLKDIKFLHKKSLYNFMSAPLNRFIIQKNNVLFDALSTMSNFNTIVSAHDICKNIEEIYSNNSRFNNLSMDSNSCFINNDTKNMFAYFNLLSILNKMNYDGIQIVMNFMKDYKMKNDILQNYNEIYNRFLKDGFDSLPTFFRDIYKPPFDCFFRKTYDANVILFDINSYNNIKKILKINYEEYNMMYKYEIKFN